MTDQFSYLVLMGRKLLPHNRPNTKIVSIYFPLMLKFLTEIEICKENHLIETGIFRILE